MNRQRRNEIVALYRRIESLKVEVENLADADDMKSGVEEVRDSEQEAFEGMPESVQQGEQGSKASEAISQLETAIDKLDEIATAITTLNDDLQEVLDALDAAKV